MEPGHKSRKKYFALHKYQQNLHRVTLKSDLWLVVAWVNFEEPVVEDFLSVADLFLVRENAAVVIVQDFSITLILVLVTQFINFVQYPTKVTSQMPRYLHLKSCSSYRQLLFYFILYLLILLVLRNWLRWVNGLFRINCISQNCLLKFTGIENHVRR